MSLEKPTTQHSQIIHKRYFAFEADALRELCKGDGEFSHAYFVFLRRYLHKDRSHPQADGDKGGGGSGFLICYVTRLGGFGEAEGEAEGETEREAERE